MNRTPHALTPVGMFGFQSERSGMTTDLTSIFEGSAFSAYEACNGVQAYQEIDQVITPHPIDAVSQARSQYVTLVQTAANVSGGRMKCLVGDFTQKKGIHWFYDPWSGNEPYPAPATPNLSRVADFVDQFIVEMNALGLQNNALGWRLADEPTDLNGTATKPSLADVTAVCQAAHAAQVFRGWNKPFYIVFYLDALWINGGSIDFANGVTPWVDAVMGTVSQAVPAKLVIQIDLQTEGIAAAIPDSSGVISVTPHSMFRTNFTAPLPPQPPNVPRTKQGGAWVTFNAATRGVVSFVVRNSSQNIVRTFDWNYSDASVQMKAVNTVINPPGKMEALGATTIVFDGRDSGNHLLPRGTYTIQMQLGTTQIGNAVAFEIQDARLPFELPQESGLIAL